MTRTLDLRRLDGAKARDDDPVLFSSESSKRGGVRSPPPQAKGVIFQENFDDQPDWTSAMHSTDREQFDATHIIPYGWYTIRQDPKWSPSMGNPSGHESIEVLASNSDKARGGAGKSYVAWRDGVQDPEWYWSSESIMTWYDPGGFDGMYVEFWINFSDDFTFDQGNISKVFRIGSWSGQGSIYNAFGGGDQGPLVMWNAQQTSFGVRNYLSFRGGPWGDNYLFSESRMPNLRRSMGSSGSVNANFSSDVQGYNRNDRSGSPQIVDRVNGGFLPTSGTITPQQIFGDKNHWTKMGFFVKMNSHPDINDGEFKQWLDDELIFDHDEVQWTRPSTQLGDPIIMPKWNHFKIGGNDYFKSYPEEDKRQEWYAIDDIVVRDSIPEGLI